MNKGPVWASTSLEYFQSIATGSDDQTIKVFSMIWNKLLIEIFFLFYFIFSLYLNKM